MRRALSSIHHAARLDQPFLRVLPRALGRLMSLAALIAFALFTTGASHGEAGAEMLEEYNRLLNIFILIAGILAGFSLVWAAFVLMWGEPETPMPGEGPRALSSEPSPAWCWCSWPRASWCSWWTAPRCCCRRVRNHNNKKTRRNV